MNSNEETMGHVPMCVMCGLNEVQIVVNSTGAGYCSHTCEQSYYEDEYERDLDANDLWEALESARRGLSTVNR